MTEPQFARSRFASIMSYAAYNHLEAVTRDQRTIRYEIPMSKYFTATRPSRLLTQVIQKYAKAMGHVANENVQGGLRKNRDKWEFVYTGGKPGQEDITYFANGKVYALELKIGKDRQSEAQKKYQERMEAANISYKIIRSFDDLLELLNKQQIL